MNLDTALELLARDAHPGLDVGEVSLALARDEYPDLDIEAYLNELSAMAYEARRYLRGRLDAKVTGFCRYLFHEMGFRGNPQNYYDPLNSYLNQVLDRRTGIPITLSAVAMAVGIRAGFSVVGVALPGHFIAKAVEGDEEVLFDPFHGGRVLTPSQAEVLVEQVTGNPFQATPPTLAPVPLNLMVVRMLNNLKAVYLQAEDFRRAVRVIERLRQLVPDEPHQRRDLGVCLLHNGQPGPAIDHLAAYLAAVPMAGDFQAVRGFLSRARAEISRWN